MDDTQDAFGHILRDYLGGQDSHEIIERDDGNIDSASASGYFASYKDWPPRQRQAMRYVRGRVLDIGCGAGRHALHLQERGYEVVGIDASPLAIEVCRHQGLRDATAMSITQISSRLGRFDTILMLGNNFGLFGGFDRARRLLKRFHGITNDGARIIAESLNPYDTTEPFHLDYHQRNQVRGRMPGQIRLRVRYKRYATPWFDYLFVSKAEMEQILVDGGWRVRRYIDSIGPTYVAIIEKAG